MMPVTATSSPVWVTMSEVKMGSPRYPLFSSTYFATIDFTSSAATMCPPTPPTNVLVTDEDCAAALTTPRRPRSA
jgi:hypothetical protein